MSRKVRRFLYYLRYPDRRGIRRFTENFLRDSGADVSSYVLNAGSGLDIFEYRRFFPNATYYTLDLDAKRRPDFVGNIEDFASLRGESVDCLVLLHTLGFTLVDEGKVVDACFRILKPMGILLISFNSSAFPSSPYSTKKYNTIESIQLVSRTLKVVEASPYFERGLLMSTFIKAVKA